MYGDFRRSGRAHAKLELSKKGIAVREGVASGPPDEGMTPKNKAAG